jgi:ureidoglycolate lyase
MQHLVCEPLSPEAFAPFGDVLWAGRGEGASANQGTAVRYDWAAALESRRPGAKPNLSIFRAAAQSLPLPIKLLERHPSSTQVFLPLLCSRYLVVVAPTLPSGDPDLTGLRAFLCGPGQGINYACGTWHHPMVALDTPAELAMLAWEDRTSGDCEVRPLSQPLLAREP